MSSLCGIWTARGTVTGAMLAMLITGIGLAGCGRKGGLDPPPMATPTEPAPVPQGAPGGQPMAPAPPAR